MSYVPKHAAQQNHAEESIISNMPVPVEFTACT